MKEIEAAEDKVMDTLMTGGFNEELLCLANEKAAWFKQEKLALAKRLEKITVKNGEVKEMINLAKKWRNAEYREKKEAAGIIIERIVMSEDGNLNIVWNI